MEAVWGALLQSAAVWASSVAYVECAGRLRRQQMRVCGASGVPDAGTTRVSIDFVYRLASNAMTVV